MEGRNISLRSPWIPVVHDVRNMLWFLRTVHVFNQFVAQVGKYKTALYSEMQANGVTFERLLNLSFILLIFFASHHLY